MLNNKLRRQEWGNGGKNRTEHQSLLDTDGMIIPEESKGKWVKAAEGGERKRFEMVIS